MVLFKIGDRTFRSLPSLDRSGNGVVIDHALFDLAQGLGTSANNLKIAAIQIEHVRGGVHLTELSVCIEWVKGCGSSQPLGRYSLDDITGNDMRLESGHKALVPNLSNIGNALVTEGNRRLVGLRRHRGNKGLGQPPRL